MRPKLTLKQKKKMYELWLNGIPKANLAERYSVSVSLVKNIIAKAKVAGE